MSELLERRAHKRKYFLISSVLDTDIVSTNIKLGYRTDHSMSTITLKLGKIECGQSYWKFNDSLLKDIEYVNKIKQWNLELKRNMRMLTKMITYH